MLQNLLRTLIKSMIFFFGILIHDIHTYGQISKVNWKSSLKVLNKIIYFSSSAFKQDSSLERLCKDLNLKPVYIVIYHTILE